METKLDALVVVSFGGPEGPEEVMPFLERVLRGKNVPRERMLEVAHHYHEFGGVSPINDQNRQLIRALEARLRESGPILPVYWGNRNWHPFLVDTVRRMKDDGVQRALAFVTSAYSSYSSCRQYLDDIARARVEAGPGAPVIEKLRTFFNHPGFVGPVAENVRQAFQQIPDERRAYAKLIFTAHSIPTSMAAPCDYERQLSEAARLVAEGLGRSDWSLVYQSRSGPPHQPWLEPDIGDFLAEIAAAGVRDVVVSPIGFISDHMEVLYDLDLEARALCAELGLNMVRAATVGTHPDFVSMIRELVLERVTEQPVRKYLGSLGPGPDHCLENCCPRSA